MKIIEFNGDYWHCNPALYDSNFFHQHSGKYAKDIWAYDKQKIKTANDRGFEVKIVWWSDFIKDKKKIIDEASKWLTQNDKK